MNDAKSMAKVRKLQRDTCVSITRRSFYSLLNLIMLFIWREARRVNWIHNVTNTPVIHSANAWRTVDSWITTCCVAWEMTLHELCFHIIIGPLHYQSIRKYNLVEIRFYFFICHPNSHKLRILTIRSSIHLVLCKLTYLFAIKNSIQYFDIKYKSVPWIKL